MRNRITILFLLVTLLSFFTSALLTQDDRLKKDESSCKNRESETNVSDLIESSQTASITKRELEKFDIKLEEGERLAYRVYWYELAPIVEGIPRIFMNLHEECLSQTTFIKKSSIILDEHPIWHQRINDESDDRRREQPRLSICVTFTFHDAYDRLHDDEARTADLMREYVIDLIINKFLSRQCYGYIDTSLTIHVNHKQRSHDVEGQLIVTEGEPIVTAQFVTIPEALLTRRPRER